ncbi:MULTISPECIES: hypothetical protein [unclassified Streptomyces]|uniref:Secreted protein n=1 Tax=Streptomyces sp. NBC_00180 TaxID=2903632 RepID=A0AAU1I0J4_9ACTN|nr:hypothetical protein OG331_31460 [Streptomyces sp. NBC_01017]
MTAALIGGGVAITTKGGGSGGDESIADPTACKAKLTENYRRVMANGAKGPTPATPTACAGLNEKSLKRITGEVITEYLDSDQAAKDLAPALPSPSLPASADVSPECRTWIKAELLDDTEEIDATPGYDACGDLSGEELQAAIDAVAEELSAQITPES